MPISPLRIADCGWVQWTLQYLIDDDVILSLAALRRSLRKKGLMVLSYTHGTYVPKP